MAISKPSKSVKWKCRRCGRPTTVAASMGRPMPGQCTNNKDKNGKMGPHSWEKIG